MTRTIRVYTVVHDVPERRDGDVQESAHFRRESDAATFAARATCWGRPATVVSADVPSNIASRWAAIA